MMKDTEINPHAKEAWKVTKSTAKGHYIVYIFNGVLKHL